MNIDALLHNLLNTKDPFGHMAPEYRKKYLHKIPDTEVVQREKFILAKCIDKVVLDIGCGNSLHKALQEVGKKVYGIDIVHYDSPNFILCDVTDPVAFRKTKLEDIEVILCADIIEHLSNPGIFLDTLKEMYPNVEKVFCAPNFQCAFFKDYIKTLHENVNDEHVAYYSYYTLNNLLTRHKLEVKNFYWYEYKNNYPHGFNEGLVFIAI